MYGTNYNPAKAPEQHDITGKVNGRLALCAPVFVLPGQRGPVALPYKGRTATAYLQAELAGEAEWLTDVDVNHGQYPVMLFHYKWADNGNSGGYTWPQFVEVL